MNAYTIAIGPCYRDMAAIAKASYEQHANFDSVRILTPERHGRAAQFTKLTLFDQVSKSEGKFFYFDADTMMLQDADLSFGFVEGFSGILTEHPDQHRFGIDPDKYFNSGIMWLDRAQHLELFEYANALPEQWLALRDQAQLNIAAKELEIKIVPQDEKYNRMVDENDDTPEDTVIKHFVGRTGPWVRLQRMKEAQ